MNHPIVQAAPWQSGVPSPPDLGLYNVVGAFTVRTILLDSQGRKVWAGDALSTATPRALGYLLLAAGCPVSVWNSAIGAIVRPAAAVAFDTAGSDDTGTTPTVVNGQALSAANDPTWAAGVWTPIAWAAR